MKKRRIILSVVALILFGLFFTSFLPAATIVYIKGKVQVQRSKERGWRKAKVGTSVDIGDKLRTAARSMADIVLDDAQKNLIRVEEKTLLAFDSTSLKQINRLDISHGKVYANIENLEEGLAFEVKTPSVVSGVRGTGWSVDSGEKQDEIAVFEDKVYLRAFDQQNKLVEEITIPEGYKVITERFQKPGKLIKLTEKELEYWNEFKMEVSERAAKIERGASKSSGFQSVAVSTGIEDKLERISEFQENIGEHLGEIQEQLENMFSEDDWQRWYDLIYDYWSH